MIFLLLALLLARGCDESRVNEFDKDRWRRSEQQANDFLRTLNRCDTNIVRRYVMGPEMFVVESNDYFNIYYSEDWGEQWVRGNISYREYLDLRQNKCFDYSDTTVNVARVRLIIK